MLAKSHLSLGLIGGILAFGVAREIDISKEFYFGIMLPFILLGSVFPDIDEPKSYIGRKLTLISHIVSISFSHRGFTHFIAFPLIFLIFGIFLINVNFNIALILFAFSYGILLHQIGDMLTISGIPHYFFPFSKARAVLLLKVLRFRTGSTKEMLLLTIAFIPLIAFLATNFGVSEFDMNIDIKNILNLLGELSSK